MKRITPIVKTIADAHIEARKTGVWTGGKVYSKSDIVREMYSGRTFEQVMEAIERRYCSITSTLMSNVVGYTSATYRNNVYKGFKEIFFNK
jgi:hypothetical protein